MTFDAFIEYVARPRLERLAAKSVWRSWCYRIDRLYVEIDVEERTPKGPRGFRIHVTVAQLNRFSENREFLAERIDESTRAIGWGC